jgi:2-methylcitrate dehydratase PrpD
MQKRGYEMKRSLTELLVQDLSRPVSPEARHKAAVHVLDWLGTVLGGLTTEDGQILLAHARVAGDGPCYVLGAGARDPMMAAFIHGGLAIALELDDMHLGARLHPGDAVIPAAFACAQAVGADADAFLDAVVRGYEAMIRIGESAGPGHYRYWHNTSTCGPFGSAAAACSLMRLLPEAWVHALGNAGTQACGFWQCREEKTMSKVIHAGRAAQSGLLAAYLGRDGLTGPRYILEGPYGFYAATCPDPDPSALARAVGDPSWKIAEATLKPWAACGHVHPCLDASLSLSSRVNPDSISTVLVRTYKEAVLFADCAEPRSDLEYKFSLQHAAAVGLLGNATLANFSAPAAASPRFSELRSRVTVEVSAPPATSVTDPWGAEVQVVTHDQERISATSRQPKGSPGNPLTLGEVKAKFSELAGLARVHTDDAENVVSAALGLTSGGSFASLSSAVASLAADALADGQGPARQRAAREQAKEQV